jgi:hypothetical protein
VESKAYVRDEEKEIKLVTSEWVSSHGKKKNLLSKYIPCPVPSHELLICGACPI